MNGARPFLRLMRRIFPVFPLLAIVLGLWGFVAPTTGTWVDWHAAVVKTLQLFMSNVSPTEMTTLPAQIAALLAPVAVIGTAVFAFGARLRRYSWEIWLRFRPASHLFLGNGETAAAIACHQRKHGSDCVGLDPQGETPFTQAMELEGGAWFVDRGDARSVDDLQRLNAGQANNIWVLTGDDTRNLEVAQRVIEVCRYSRKRPGSDQTPTRLNILVNDRELIRGLHTLFGGVPAGKGGEQADGLIRGRHTLFGGSTDIDIEFFSILRSAARELLRQHPPPLLRPPTQERPSLSDGTVVHLAVIGDGPLAEAIVVHAVTHLVYAEQPSDCLRISLIGRGAEMLNERLRRKFPALDPATARDPRFAPLLPLARITTHVCEATEILPDDWCRLQAEQAFAIIYVACDQNLHTVGAATRVAALRDLPPVREQPQPIVACLRSASGMSFDQKKEVWSVFRVTDEGTAAVVNPGGVLDKDSRAKLVNLGYVNKDAPTLKEPDRRIEVEKAWKPTSHENRWSSRFSADHFDIKLAWLGLPVSALKLAEGHPRFKSELERLMRLEHRRFIAERLLDGWLPGPDTEAPKPSGLSKEEQKKLLRINTTLVPFDELRSEDREKDKAVVEAMRDFFANEPPD